MKRVVARLGRAHGLSGEVTAQVLTDVPDLRLQPGVVFDTEPPAAGPLTLISVHDHSGTTLLRFRQATDRAGAEGLRGVCLVVDLPASDEPDAWYPQELVGLAAQLPDGTALGTVRRLVPGSAQDLVEVATVNGALVLVPFVRALVPIVDVAAGRMVIDPPLGLFEAPADD